MSDTTELSTLSELQRLRVQMRQAPRTMATLLGVRLPTYYRWEKLKNASKAVTMAVRFLATQDIPEDPQFMQRQDRSSKTRFLPGARFGRLVVLRLLPPIGSGMNLRVAVQCDCGVAKTWYTGMLNKHRQCSKTCPLTSEPFPDAPPPPAPIDEAMEPGLDD